MGGLGGLLVVLRPGRLREVEIDISVSTKLGLGVRVGRGEWLVGVDESWDTFGEDGDCRFTQPNGIDPAARCLSL